MKLSYKLFLCLVLLALALSACGKIDTGITGKTVLGACRGTQIGADCIESSTYAGSLTIYGEGFNKIKTIKTNGDGTFTVALKPGVYFIHPENSGSFPMATDFKVTVTKGKLTDLTIYYDTGVRDATTPTP